MKTITITRYQCELCECTYDSEKAARKCESRPVAACAVVVGDTVRVIRGDGAGQLMTVTDMYVIDREWGHYLRDRYWHTMLVTASADMLSRILTFDDYERVGPAKPPI